MPVGTVQSKKFSKSGSAMFGIDGQTYFVSRNVPMQGLEPGVGIEYEWEEFGDDRGRGRPRTITKWRPAQSQGQASNASQNRANGASQASASKNADVLILPFLSNTIAHAIQAGLIKEPVQLTSWVIEGRRALAAKMPKPNVAPAEEDFDDEIPF